MIIRSSIKNIEQRRKYSNLPKKKGASQRGIGHPVPSHLNESPFAISIPNPAEKINPSDENSSKISFDDGRSSISRITADMSAVLVERHDNRYYFDTNTVYFDNLISGYINGNEFVPIRFGLKHSRTGTTTLYVVVDQNAIDIGNLAEIKKDTGRQAAPPDSPSGANELHRRVTYSISQIIEFVNSKDLLRYLPDQMLNEVQRTAKTLNPILLKMQSIPTKALTLTPKNSIIVLDG